MRNIKDSKKYHLNRSLLLQLRRGGQHYGEYNNKDLDSLKHEVQTEVKSRGISEST